MTQQSKHARQAAIVATGVAFIVSILPLAAGKGFFFLMPLVLIGTFVTTFYLWRWAFRSAQAGLWRAAWVGALIVVIALFVLTVGLTIINSQSLEDLAKGVVLALAIYIVAGPILIPLGALCSVAIRWRQLRALAQPTGEDR